MNAGRPGGVSRRAVVRTAAWAVPTVSLVAAAPAYAASPPLPTFGYAAGGPVSWFTMPAALNQGVPAFAFSTLDPLLPDQRGVLTLPAAPTRPVLLEVRAVTTGPAPAAFTPRFALGGSTYYVDSSSDSTGLVESAGVTTWTGVIPPSVLTGGPNLLDATASFTDDGLLWPPTQVDITVFSEEFGTLGPVVHVAPAVFPPYVPPSPGRASGTGHLVDFLGGSA